MSFGPGCVSSRYSMIARDWDRTWPASSSAGHRPGRTRRSGVRFQIADRMIHGREGDLDRALGANPVNWPRRPPPGHAGEVAAARVAALEPGSWFFDVDRRELGYVPRQRQP